MKKILFIMSIASLLLGSIFTMRAIACPPGYMSDSFVWTYNGLSMTITYCWSCSIGPSTGNITNLNIQCDKNTDLNLQDADIWDAQYKFTPEFSTALLNAIADRFFLRCQLHPCNEPPPGVFVYDIPTCFSYENVLWYDANNNPHYNQFFELGYCLDYGHCRKTLATCRIYPGGGISSTLISQEFIGDPCLTNKPDTSELPLDEEWHTECYQMWPCDSIP